MMTRKNFQMVAEIISKIQDLNERKAMAEHNAAIFARNNPRFDRSRFFAACGVK